MRNTGAYFMMLALGWFSLGGWCQTKASVGHPPNQYSVTDLGSLGANHSQAKGLNNQGQVVGELIDGTTWTSDLFVWSNGKMARVGHLPGTKEIYAARINNKGHVAGTVRVGNTDKEWLSWAFKWQNGRMERLRADRIAAAYAINDAGKIVGDMAAPGDTRGRIRRATLWDGDTVIDLGTLGGKNSEATDINNRGQIVGNASIKSADAHVDGAAHGFLWQDGKMTDLGTWRGGEAIEAIAINDRGVILGYADDKRGRQYVVLWENGQIRPLPGLGEEDQVVGINSQDQVVGNRTIARLDLQVQDIGFIYTNGKMYDLNSLIPKRFDCNILKCVAINDKGQIAAIGTLHGHSPYNHALLLTPVRPQ